MATLNTPGTGSDDGGQVVSLEATRAAHIGPDTPPATGPGPAPASEPGEPGTPGGPVLEGEVIRVDQPGSDPTDWLANLGNQVRERRPIIHPALRSRHEAVATVRWVAAHYRHVALYHLVRVPKYGGKLAVRAPRGFTRTISGLTRWAYDLEGVPVRMATVLKADPEAYLKLSRQRDSRVRLRVPIAILAGLAALTAAVLTLTAPAPVKLAVLAAAVAIFGKLGGTGRPAADRPGRGPAPRREADQRHRDPRPGLPRPGRDQPGHRQEPAHRDRVQGPDHPRRPRLARRPRPALRRHRGRGHGPAGQARVRSAPPARLRVARS